MRGVDTNVLARYCFLDDPDQDEIAVKYMYSASDQNPIFISHTALVELHWLFMSKRYQKTKEDWIQCVDLLLQMRGIVIQEYGAVATALYKYRNCTSTKVGFADCLIQAVSEHKGCTYTFSFDKHAQLIGMTGPEDEPVVVDEL